MKKERGKTIKTQPYLNLPRPLSPSRSLSTPLSLSLAGGPSLSIPARGAPAAGSGDDACASSRPAGDSAQPRPGDDSARSAGNSTAPLPPRRRLRPAAPRRRLRPLRRELHRASPSPAGDSARPRPVSHSVSPARARLRVHLEKVTRSRAEPLFCGSARPKGLQSAGFAGLRTWSRDQNNRLGGLRLEPLVELEPEPSQTGPYFWDL
jgi:hypothetical protein